MNTLQDNTPQPPNTSSTVSTTTISSTTSPAPIPKKSSMLFTYLLIGLLTLIAIGVGAFYFMKPSATKNSANGEVTVSPTSAPTSAPTSIPTATPVIEVSPTTTPDSTTSAIPTATRIISSPVIGANLAGIKYTLPSTWKAELSADNLMLSPKTGGGYFSIKVYDYPSEIGRREYFCQITKVCIDSTTYTDVKIGNITGYVADSMDNSGGGPMYFGAKGTKFYIISSFTPPSPNEFDKTSQTVLGSLIF